MIGVREPFGRDVITGHYGVGKTNLTPQPGLDARYAGMGVTVTDLDVVNPVFPLQRLPGVFSTMPACRWSRPCLQARTLDGPAISGTIEPAIDWRATGDGDGCYRRCRRRRCGRHGARAVAAAWPSRPYELLYVVNRNRNLTQEPPRRWRCCARSRRNRTCGHGGCNNTHLQHDTEPRRGAGLSRGVGFAQRAARWPVCPWRFPRCRAAVRR